MLGARRTRGDKHSDDERGARGNRFHPTNLGETTRPEKTGSHPLHAFGGSAIVPLMKTFLVAACSLALASCSNNASPPEVLTNAKFTAAKRICGAAKAYVSTSKGQRSVHFRGVASDLSAVRGQATCLMRELDGTDIRFISFVGEPPQP